LLLSQLKKAAEKGNARACSQLGASYRESLIDLNRFFELWQQSITQDILMHYVI